MRPARQALAGLALVMLAGCQSLQSALICPSPIASIPLERGEGHVYVQTLIAGRPARLVLDTGAEVSLLTEGATQRLGLIAAKLPPHRIGGIGGHRTAATLIPAPVEAGGSRLGPWPFLETDLGHGRPWLPADGILGADFLAPYDYALDLSRNRLELSPPAPTCFPASAPGTVTLLELRPRTTASDPPDPLPTVPTTIGSTAMTALIDTGSPDNVLFPGGIEKLRVPQAEIAAHESEPIFGVGPGSTRVAIAALDRVTIGALHFSDVPVAVMRRPLLRAGEPDLLFGLALLEGLDVQVSHAAGKVRFRAAGGQDSSAFLDRGLGP